MAAPPCGWRSESKRSECKQYYRLQEALFPRSPVRLFVDTTQDTQVFRQIPNSGHRKTMTLRLVGSSVSSLASWDVLTVSVPRRATLGGSKRNPGPKQILVGSHCGTSNPLQPGNPVPKQFWMPSSQPRTTWDGCCKKTQLPYWNIHWFLHGCLGVQKILLIIYCLWNIQLGLGF